MHGAEEFMGWGQHAGSGVASAGTCTATITFTLGTNQGQEAVKEIIYLYVMVTMSKLPC
jgi:hypothetical protein